jgi:predicted nuclease with RNAse H fold/uncharacterized protein YprB with RNaseH-like and TPR domain/dephospho-CoA kinase
MLKNTFLHLPGFGYQRERSLWEEGVLTWDDLERKLFSQISFLPSDTDRAIVETLRKSREALSKNDLSFFANRLPKGEHYRIALTDPSATVFLDIETTGLSFYYDRTTMIGLADLDRHYLYVRGQKLDRIAERLSTAQCLVTFNGTMFDLKFLQTEFPDLHIPKAHVDLRFFGRRVGLVGPQKEIEQELEFARPYEIRSVVGETAPLLWFKYINGELDAGRQLAEYNFSDIEGMKFILDSALKVHVHQDSILSKFVQAPQFFKGEAKFNWSPDSYGEDRNVIYIPPFQKQTAPKLTYSDLANDRRSRELRVVGIDLTGSEKRPTGWCLLVGGTAETRLLSADKEIIDATIASKPHLVSIDSPLSLPKGRTRVTNDDPGRDKYGIMRECERTLKKRGVNVYPSLIDSMQQLTARGIRMANKFRKVGIPVIESYPGAAQDIMGIPRKRAGLEYLKRGLGEFGLFGPFLTEKVAHDEVDAVTSALVGLFFWRGKFEALGNRDEEYLIIPDLNVDPEPWNRRLVIGLSGAISSGKTTGAKFLEEKQFGYGRYSQILSSILEERGERPTRTALQKLGERIHKKPGQRWLSQELVSRMPPNVNLVIDGLRFPEDHAFLSEAFGPGFVHIHVTASEKIRKARYISEGQTEAAFDRAARHPVEMLVPQLASLAHISLKNERSKRAYYKALGRVVHKLERRDWNESQSGIFGKIRDLLGW